MNAEAEIQTVKVEFREIMAKKQKQLDLDEEEAEKEKAKIKMKEDMEKAARYVQERWKWFQDEGKLLAKKRRKGGKGKGGKKGKKK